MARTDHCKYLKISDCQPRKEVSRPDLDEKPENILVPQNQLIFLAFAAVKDEVKAKLRLPT